MLVVNDGTQHVIERASDGHCAYSLVLKPYSKSTVEIFLEDEYGNHIAPGDNLVVYDSGGVRLRPVDNSFMMIWIETYTVHALGQKYTFTGTSAFTVE